MTTSAAWDFVSPWRSFRTGSSCAHYPNKPQIASAPCSSWPYSRRKGPRQASAGVARYPGAVSGLATRHCRKRRRLSRQQRLPGRTSRESAAHRATACRVSRGHLRRGEVPSLSRPDIYVLPTYSDNFALTVAEALSMATPAIVSKGAPWSGLEENGAGWWVDIGVDPLAACLRAAMALRKDLAAKGQRGRARDGARFRLGQHSVADDRNLSVAAGDRSRPVPAWVRLD